MSEQKPMSLKAKIATKTLRQLNIKEKVDFLNPPRIRRQKMPKFLINFFPYDEGEINGFRYFTFGKDTSRHVLFLHGGGYAMEATIGHYFLIKRIMEMYPVKVTIIEYPLAPEHQALETHEVVMTLYKRLIEAEPNVSFTFLGDSAGGGLALSLAQCAKAQGLKMPESTILVSPWLDIALENPEILTLCELDVLLQLDNVKKIGELYRGQLKESDPLVSPLYGDLEGLGNIAVFYTSDEILKPDCEKLLARAYDQTKFKGFEFEALWHDFVLWPIPEREQFLELISAYLY